MLGTKIIAAGAILAIICASCPAPEVMRRQGRPRLFAAPSIISTILRSNRTGSKRARRSTLIETPPCFKLLQKGSQRGLFLLQAALVRIPQIDGENSP